MKAKLFGLLLAVLAGLAGPAAAEHGDGVDNDGDGQFDEPDEHVIDGPPISGGEVAC